MTDVFDGTGVWPALAVAVIVAAAACVGLVHAAGARRIVRRPGIAVPDGAAWRSPVVMITVLAGLDLFVGALESTWSGWVRALLGAGLVAVVAWSLVVVAPGAIPGTAPVLRQLGHGLLASAGLVGIDAGSAAQSTPGNLFAGLQVALAEHTAPSAVEV